MVYIKIRTHFFSPVKKNSKISLIFNMTKKIAQPKEALKPVLDEENEPFLRALQKKVRNINKKLIQISQLQGKENLKPQQVEKVGRKAALLEERARIEETATLFRQNYAENIAVYRAAQLKELETLARAIALYHTGAKLPESERLSSLWSALSTPTNAETLNEAITSLSTTLKTFADDRKLQKSLSAFVEEHGNQKIEVPAPQETKIVAVEAAKPVETVEIKPETVKQAPVAVEAATSVSQQKVETKEAEVPFPVVENIVVAEVKPAETVSEEKIQAVASTPVQEVTEEKPKEDQNRRDNRGREQRDNRDNREGRGGRPRGDYRRRDNEEPRERRQYKPKAGERQPEEREVREGEESSGSDSEPEVRDFKKEEIRKLEEEGFIVVGKPKPKPKNPKESFSAHEKQHGKKYHHHNNNQQY